MKPPTADTWLRILHGLSNLHTVPEFAAGTHAEVFGRDFGPWQWVGVEDGYEEHLHGWLLPIKRWWVMLPVSTCMAVTVDPEADYGPVHERSFDEAHLNARLAMLREVRKDAIIADSFAALGEKLSYAYIPLSQDADAMRAARFRALSVWAQTDTERAEVMLSTLRLRT